MNCPNCGVFVKEGSKFCGTCGTKLEVVEAVETPVQPSAPEPAPNTAQAYNSGASFGGAAPYSAPTPNPAPVYSAPQQNMYRQEGCLGAAWRDITSSAGWIKRMLLLAIMNCVPVLNFFVAGYSAKWGANVASGVREPLPTGNFTKHTFIVGVFISLLNILMIIANIWLFVLNFIPLIGFIIVFIVNLFASAFFALAVMRMTIRRKLGAAFDLSEIMKRYKTRVGSLVASAVVPGIITTIVFALVAMLILLICSGIAMRGIGMYGGSSYSSMMYMFADMSYNPVGAAIALVSALGVVIFILVALYLFLDAFANVWSMRAVGHWVSQNAPQWADDEAEEEIERL